jgi:hypothetical protein
MNRISTSLGAVAIALAGFVLSAEDFQPLMKATQTTWPEKRHIGVICDYQSSKDQVEALARAAGAGNLITVADARRLEQADAAATLLANHMTDFVVLMPHDRYFRDGSFGATLAMNRLAHLGVPSIGTTPIAVKHGAAFSVGDGTEGQILVSSHLIGTVNVILPDGALTSQKSSLVLERKGMAAISVESTE